MSFALIDNLAILKPWWLLASLCCLLLAIRSVQRSHGGWHKVMTPDVLHFLGGGGHSRATRWRLVYAAAIAVALAAPALRISDAQTWRHSTAWIAILDVSRSMTLDDVTPSRLAGARDAVVALSDAAGARPLALIVFSGDAFLVTPPAFDHELLKTQTNLLEHGSVPIEGSNIARALSLATSVVMDSGLVSARLFLLGDSAGANKNALGAARYLAEAGHRLDVLQFGRGDIDAGEAGKINLTAAELLAQEGGGRLVVADAFGNIEFGSLKLDDQQADVDGLRAVLWKHLSHWLLIPLVVLMPWLARRRSS